MKTTTAAATAAAATAADAAATTATAAAWRRLNLGSGKDFREHWLNVDRDPLWRPDIVADLNRAFPGDQRVFDTRRFGPVRLEPACLDHIVANDLLEHVGNLTGLVTNCLELLQVGGVLEVSVPYDLSYGAWQDPTHVRAFNERSWLYYTDWFWYLGWQRARFHLDKLDFSLSQVGLDMRGRGIDDAALLRAPRAVDSMRAWLRKAELTDADRKAAAQYVRDATA